MKQFQFKYINAETFKRDLYKIDSWRKSNLPSNMVFQIYTETMDKPLIKEICGTIEKTFPDSPYFGCSTNGNIYNGQFSDSPVVIGCTVSEYPTTKTEIMQYYFTQENAEEVAGEILKKLESRPWVKMIEVTATVKRTSTKRFFEVLQTAREDIRIFGGGAFTNDINSDDACVFSKENGLYDNGAVFVLVGGEDFYVETTYITGWKPLCKEFRITKAKDAILYEIDSQPAFDVYHKYLNIENDENLVTSALEFPLFFEHNGIQLLRCPMACNPDRSLLLSGIIEENVSARLAYGDPWTILEIVRRESQKIREFRPDIIKVFSCAVRKLFWGSNEIGKETEPFQNIAQTSGFYTSGEFLRTDGKINHHNNTLVIAALREGEPTEGQTPDLDVSENEYSGRVSMINRLATYINVATNELEEANKKLAYIAVTDGLTKLYNRAEIQRRIKKRLVSGEKMSLVMLDIDNFKHVNDTFGHGEGDTVIVKLSELLRDFVEENGENTAAGRWGGEEFMLMLPCRASEAAEAAEKLRVTFAELCFPAAKHQTLSLGVTEAKSGESLDALLVRVDKALYSAKNNGKNQCILLNK